MSKVIEVLRKVVQDSMTLHYVNLIPVSSHIMQVSAIN